MTGKEKPEKTKFQGKRVATFKRTLPVSKDEIELREVGVLTSRKIEEMAGITREQSVDLEFRPLNYILEAREKIFDEILPHFVVTEGFKQDEYTEDDLFDIIVAIYGRGQMGLGVTGGEEAESFPEKPGGTKPGDTGAKVEPASE